MRHEKQTESTGKQTTVKCVADGHGLGAEMCRGPEGRLSLLWTPEPDCRGDLVITEAQGSTTCLRPPWELGRREGCGSDSKHFTLASGLGTLALASASLYTVPLV